jgi:hypothetical protein
MSVRVRRGVGRLQPNSSVGAVRAGSQGGRLGSPVEAGPGETQVRQREGAGQSLEAAGREVAQTLQTAAVLHQHWVAAAVRDKERPARHPTKGGGAGGKPWKPGGGGGGRMAIWGTWGGMAGGMGLASCGASLKSCKHM